MVAAKVWIIEEKPEEMPSEKHFRCIEEELPLCNDGDIIIEAEFLSVDPYMRYRIRHNDVKTAVFGSQVAKVIESKNEKYPVGTHVIGYPGWRTRTHLSKQDLEKSDMSFSYMKLPELGDFPRSTALGVLGMPGNTAYFGFLDILKPKAGETVLVNAAAGAVGSCVCQIAKIKGCKVIGLTGSEEKVKYVKDLGVDHVFNYKTTNIAETLKQVAPDGINCYFDNVGGQLTAEVLPHMALFGRISICGCISQYNCKNKDIGDVSLSSPFSESTLLWKQLKVEGFIVSRWVDRWMEGINQIKEWITEGKLTYRETVTRGFENMPNAFIGLFSGENIGKAIVAI